MVAIVVVGSGGAVVVVVVASEVVRGFGSEVWDGEWSISMGSEGVMVVGWERVGFVSVSAVGAIGFIGCVGLEGPGGWVRCDGRGSGVRRECDDAGSGLR